MRPILQPPSLGTPSPFRIHLDLAVVNPVHVQRKDAFRQPGSGNDRLPDTDGLVVGRGLDGDDGRPGSADGNGDVGRRSEGAKVVRGEGDEGVEGVVLPDDAEAFVRVEHGRETEDVVAEAVGGYCAVAGESTGGAGTWGPASRVILVSAMGTSLPSNRRLLFLSWKRRPRRVGS